VKENDSIRWRNVYLAVAVFTLLVYLALWIFSNSFD